MSRLTAIVLGAAAGGGFPQWNCRCAVCRLAWDGDQRVSARTQASLAVSVDGERWTLLNAAPDLRAQLAATPALHPHGTLRHSPIAAVVLTGAEVDQTAGLLNLRERQPFMLAATAETLGILGTNSIFDVLAADVVTRRAIEIGKPFVLPGGLTAELFIVPGKVPLYLERGVPQTAEETGANVGVEVSSDGARLCFVPGAAAVPDGLRTRLARADVVLFDGTLFTDDEMIAAGLGRKPGGAWATCRSTARAARSRRSPGLASGAFTSTSTTPIRSWSTARHKGAQSKPPAGRSRPTAWR